ncbi:MAG: aminomethyl-transferring glycine dehydrogenase subunit GcvPB [Spirochaetales bacterium]|nr:aminomethyl-transferring glycine dehydrogenase subunit GcvPB [Spirochaetales bacterium]
MNYNEPLLWEKVNGITVGYSMPELSVVESFPQSKHQRGSISIPGFSEPVIARHFTKLSTWNYGVDTDIYPLGSCTMKYNPKINEKIATLNGFINSHPLQDDSYSQGVLEVLYQTGEALKEITGMDGVTLQPAAGAQGELVSLLMFKKYHRSRGDFKRDTILIPDSAHGTNPASASLCGFKVKVVKSNEEGILTSEIVKSCMDESIAGIMITNPGTLGIFESNIKEICDIIHDGGGLVYGDGANLNALLGVIKVGHVGIDAMHMNLHKTFSTPHGGGGPGAGPVCVKSHLIPFLPVPRVIKTSSGYKMDSNTPLTIGRVHSFNGNFSVILKAYAYILTMGGEGLKHVSEIAVLNANYIRQNLKDFYHLPYKKDSLHEVLFTDKIQKEYGISTLDIAKGMIERGIHPPTIYFPLVVSGALLIEPTENESLDSLNNLINILREIAELAKDSPELLLNAPNNSKRCRVDETRAAREPILRGYI